MKFDGRILLLTFFFVKLEDTRLEFQVYLYNLEARLLRRYPPSRESISFPKISLRKVTLEKRSKL